MIITAKYIRMNIGSRIMSVAKKKEYKKKEEKAKKK